MSPQERRLTAARLKSDASYLRNRAHETRGVARGCSDPVRKQQLEIEADDDLTEAGLSELAANALEDEAKSLEADQRFLEFEEERKKLAERRRQRREAIEEEEKKKKQAIEQVSASWIDMQNTPWIHPDPHLREQRDRSLRVQREILPPVGK